MSSYDTLRRQCRTLESLLDTKLTSYSRVASTIATHQDLEAAGSIERWRDLEAEIEGLLDKLRETNEDLSIALNKSSELPSTAMLHAAQRHRDVLQDYNRDFLRIKVNVQSAEDQRNLLQNVRHDIDAYNSSSSDMLLSERGRIDSSHQMTDQVLEQAYETRSEFARQRTSLAGINARMSGVLNVLPGVNSLIGMIQSRRRRDALILGCVIGVGIVLLLTYMAR
ncbi:V-snare-domain-containing protein [Sistotremastrum suecicum HHB10207 ss-3]|uniref:Golgi SNAP receptor complex member 1 n=1 Tax=Sistotremastrum suecicum HHB10207 ss-3 TaxID=1314776 RepID=A0A166HDJ2_9AGAM|nr:V-snare-domain-containing protein [Sistotremastrum suecicum HHB10207 ss-3]